MLCTDSERDDLAQLALNSGRLYAAFVGDEGRVEEVGQQAKNMRIRSIREGRFQLFNGRPPSFTGKNH